MWRLIRKWWVLQRLEAQILIHTGKESTETIFQRLGGPTLSTDDFFIKGTDEFPGIASRPIGKWSWLLFWRRFESKEQYNRRVYQYLDFLNYWRNKGYIKNTKVINQNGVIMTELANLPHITPEADRVHGFFGLLEFIQQEYPLTWSSVWKLSAFAITSLGGLTGVIYLLIRVINNLIH